MDCKELHKLNSEKMRRINNSRSLDGVRAGDLPDVADVNEDYYFVSYSHKDYKKVYRDIFLFQERGRNIWYDRGMVNGRSWQEIAQTYINKFRCLGVIFYISEHSLMSEAIHKEIEYAKSNGKNCMFINLPAEASGGGKASDKKTLSAKEYLDELINAGYEVDGEKYKYISDILPPEVIYTPYSKSIDNKLSDIDNSFARPQLFDFGKGVYRFGVVAVNDTDIKRVESGDFVPNAEALDKARVQTGERDPVALNIDDCVFANCRDLEYIELPHTVKIIGSYAFFRCKKLKSIYLCDGFQYLGECAFEGCESLTDVYISPNAVLESLCTGAFYDCKSLERIKLPDSITKIAEHAFYNCVKLSEAHLPRGLTAVGGYAFAYCASLKLIELPDSVTELGEGAFCGCASLKDIELPSKLKSVDFGLFSDCENLERVVLPPSITHVDDCAFFNCFKLSDLIYKGDMRQWLAVGNTQSIGKSSQVRVIHCADGDIYVDR